MNKHYDLLGLGCGPFHLSLAALIEKTSLSTLFLDRRENFRWHPELLFEDADMQTSFFKDFVTPVDPTSRHSFLNYLVEHGLFYSFMNTGRRVITRIEFEQYAIWVTSRLENLSFGSEVREVIFDGLKFILKTDQEELTSKHLSIATGMLPRVPEFAHAFLGKEVFHAKSGELEGVDLTGKRVMIIGGGQTGVEILRNALNGKWGRPHSLKILSKRHNLEPLDESPFTNEYFTPHYTMGFHSIPQSSKERIVTHQKLASDGNTPAYLEGLYRDLYFLKHVKKDPLDVLICPLRTLTNLERNASGGYLAHFHNAHLGVAESIEADIVILATGLKTALPAAIQQIHHLLDLDELGRIKLGSDFQVGLKIDVPNKIYALNFGRHTHGIAEPQTSLMAWRSATIINNLTGAEIYRTQSVPTFIKYETN
jgi:lysine N6-hydroxylase